MKVLVVDGQPIVRVGVAAVLEAEEDMAVAGEAEDEQAALTLVWEKDPDVVVLDPDVEGEEGARDLCRRIKSLSEPPGVVAYAARNSGDEVLSWKLSGADSFVHKGEAPEKLIEALRETCSGKGVWFLGRLQEEGAPRGGPRGTPTERALLTPREKEVFELLARRLSNFEIACELSISHQTTKNHVSNVLRKFGVKSRAELLWGGPRSPKA